MADEGREREGGGREAEGKRGRERETEKEGGWGESDNGSLPLTR